MSKGVLCPKCGSASSSVKDSRPSVFNTTRRLRECECGNRYATVEAVLELDHYRKLSVARDCLTKALDTIDYYISRESEAAKAPSYERGQWRKK